MENRLITNPEIPRLLDRGELETALQQPVRKTEVSRLKGLLAGDDTDSQRLEDRVFAGLLLGDFLYDYIRIEPTVVEGVNFANRDDLDSVLQFSHAGQRYEELAELAQKGDLSRYQGYVAERFVGMHYQARGHDISFPVSASEPGFDILVDGAPYQVKCVQSVEEVRTHLNRYPDIPVIVNGDLAAKVEDIPGVYVDPALLREEVRGITEESLDHGADLANFELPWITAAVAGAGAIHDIVRGKADPLTAATNVTTNALGRLAVGALGEKAGATVGLFLFGPAGAIVGAGVGALAGGVAGRRAATIGRRLLAKTEEESLRNALRAAAHATAGEVPRKVRAWREKCDRVKDAFDGDAPGTRHLREYVIARMDQDIAYFQNKRQEIQSVEEKTRGKTDPLDLTRQLLNLISRAGIQPHAIREEIKLVGEAAQRLADRRKKLRV